jgi:hypothetical protein
LLALYFLDGGVELSQQRVTWSSMARERAFLFLGLQSEMVETALRGP